MNNQADDFEQVLFYLEKTIREMKKIHDETEKQYHLEIEKQADAYAEKFDAYAEKFREQKDEINSMNAGFNTKFDEITQKLAEFQEQFTEINQKLNSLASPEEKEAPPVPDKSEQQDIMPLLIEINQKLDSLVSLPEWDDEFDTLKMLPSFSKDESDTSNLLPSPPQTENFFTGVVSELKKGFENNWKK